MAWGTADHADPCSPRLESNGERHLKGNAGDERNGGLKGGALLTLLVAWGVLLAAGTWIRLNGIGARPLAVDEFYFLNGILSILDTGLPEFPGGGLYIRGLILQYTTAGIIWALGDPVVGLRLLPALLGLGTAILAVVYARRHLPLFVSLVIGVVFLFSSWQVEFSLFGRMYAGLQFFTLVYLLCFERAVEAGTRRTVVLASLVGLVGLGIHEIGMLFIPPLILAALVLGAGEDGSWRVRWSWLLAPALVFVFALLLRFADVRNMGAGPRYPEGYTFPREGPFRFPVIWGLGEEITTVLLLGGVVLAFFALLALPALRKGRPGLMGWVEAFWAGVFVASAVLHQFVLVALVGLWIWRRYGREGETGPQGRGVPGLLDDLRRPLHGMRPPVRWALVAGVAISLAWVALTGLLFALGGLDAFGIPSEAGSLAGAWRRLFFAWPDLYEPVALQWAMVFPLLTAAFFLAMLWRLVLILDRPLASLLRDPVIVLLYFVLAVGVIQPLYNSIRYTHFLYPVAFVVLGQALMDGLGPLAGRWRRGRAVGAREGRGSPGNPGILAASGVLLCLFLVSNDFHPSHLLALNEPEVAYRTGRWEGYSRAWYERSDMVSPSRYVRQEAAPSDAVVAMNMPVASYYLERPHLVFVPRDRGWRRYIALARERGTLDVWSGQPLAGTLEELEERIGGARTVWFLDTAPASPELQELMERDHWSGEKMLESRDGRYQVIRARRSDPTRPSGPGGR